MLLLQTAGATALASGAGPEGGTKHSGPGAFGPDLCAKQVNTDTQ